MLKISQVRDVLNHIIRNNRYLESRGVKKNTIMLESVAGIGKTSLIEQVARDNGLGFVKINLSNVEQAGDICGFPIREFEFLEDGEAKWVNEKELEVRGNSLTLTGKTRTSYCPPAWVPTSNQGIILLLDDFTRAPTHIMQAVMEIVDRGEYLSWKLPADCHVMLTSNPDSGEYIVTSLDDAQKTRYIRLKMKFDVNEWAEWAEFAGVDSRCINFLLLNPEMIKGSVNARLATDYFNSISSLKDFGSEETLQLISLLGGGSVGDEFSATFALFINNKLDKIPSPQKIFEFKDSADAIKAIQASVGDVNTSGYKQNIASVISTRIINFLAKIIEDKEGGFNKKFHVPRVMDIIKSRVLSNDINYNLIKTLNARRQFSQLTEDSEIVKIITR